ncbi:MAG: ribonuclease HII [Candidatus Moranbacteria bacterium]|nr:ribonuclease HII [Candidatus Moranbacteria bacterium]
MILPHLDREIFHWAEGRQVVVGIDEAGRGPLAGPVVAAAVVVRPEIIDRMKITSEWKLVRDSKMLSPKQREKAYGFVTQNFEWGIGISDEKTIDRVNILQATFLAMKKAMSGLKRKNGREIEFILIDGNSLIPNMTIAQESIVNGDRHIFSIAAASIVAKVARDRMMLEFHQKYPQYGFDRHKGYGTREHRDAIKKYGLCSIHRNSFKLI